LLLERIQAVMIQSNALIESEPPCTEGTKSDIKGAALKSQPAQWDALWLAPQSPLWARTRSARDLAQKIDKLLASQGGERAPMGLKVVVPAARRSSRERLAVYQDQFSRLLAADVSLLDGSLELLILPDALVCAMFHFNLAHNATAVPIGFMSSVPEHIASAGALVSARMRGRSNDIAVAREDGTGALIEGLVQLVERLTSPIGCRWNHKR
jgi:hypothetical protein